MTETSKKPPRKAVEWDLVAAEYRAGVKSTRELAVEYGISHTLINRRAKADGWVRDLAKKIKAQADAKVSRAAVSKDVSTATAATEKVLIEANAEVIFHVRMGHRTDIGRTRRLFQTLLEEVEVASTKEGQALIRQMAEVCYEPDPDETPEQSKERADRMRKLLSRLLGTGDRIDNAKRLTEILEKVVRLEREAFGITAGEKDESQLEELLRKLGRE